MEREKLFIGIGLIAAIVLGVWYFSGNTAEAPTDTGMSTTTAQAAAKPAAPATVSKPSVPKADSGNTYKSLLTQTGSYQCDYTQVQQSGQGKNVIYLYNGKLRAEFRSTVDGATVSNIAVYDGRYLYQWKEGFGTGTRTSISSLSELPAAIPTDLTSGKVYGTNYESVGWQCHPWLADPSLLAPPSYVTFS